MDVEAIAAGLTAAQKRAVLTNDRGFVERHKGKWAFMSTPTARILHNLGLIEAPDTLVFPTPLGLAVRQHLIEKGEG